MTAAFQIEELVEGFGGRFGGQTGRGEKRPAQDRTVDYELPVSLEEVYTGVTKKMRITR